jgi:hypothetical protein
MVFAVRLVWFHRLAGERCEGLVEFDTIEKPHQVDHVTAGFTATAIENRLADIDRKPIITAAMRAGAD